MNSTDDHWKLWGERDPYYGVITRPQYRRGALDAQTLDAFFDSGDGHVRYLMDLIHRGVDAHFAPRRVLDFGCGVGRILVPMSRLAQEVVGLDISTSMLEEARRNCDERGQGERVRLALSDDALAAAEGSFDLVHSCIVLQHLVPARGRAIFRRLVGKVEPGGVGALHLTYASADYTENEGQPPSPPPPPPPPSGLAAVKAQVRPWLRPPPPPPPPAPAPPDADPEMQMNWYDLNQLMWILQSAGIQQVYTDLTDHGGAWGVFLCFRRPAA